MDSHKEEKKQLAYLSDILKDNKFQSSKEAISMLTKNILISVIVLCLCFAGILSCQTKSDSQESNTTDTLHYDKTDFEKMQAFYLSDSSLIKTLNEQVAKGNTNAAEMLTLINTPYEEVLSKLNISKKDLDLTILAFYMSKKHMDKFKELDISIDSLNIDSKEIHDRTDSIVNAINKLSDDLK